MKTQWGDWKLDTEHDTLDYQVQPGYEYYIRLNIARTQEQIEDWVSHLSDKTWATYALLADLREALTELSKRRPA